MAPVKAKLPPAYHNLPVMLLGWLAVGNAFKGQGLEAPLLFDALKKSYNAIADIGSMAVVVEQID